jgi:hypothetical protein
MLMELMAFPRIIDSYDFDPRLLLNVAVVLLTNIRSIGCLLTHRSYATA